MNLSPSGLLSVTHLRYTGFWLLIGFSLIAGISFMSLISIPAPVKQFLLNDKLMHVAVYGCLMGWFAQIFRHDLTRLMLGILFVSMGVLIEYIQGMVPHRQFEVLDMIANTSGVVLAWALAYTWMGGLLEWFEKSFLGFFAPAKAVQGS